MPLFRRRGSDSDGIAPRRPHAGLLRRERRALLEARAKAVSDLGGLLVEMYRRGAFRDDLLEERAAVIVGVDARLAEIEELLHVRRRVPRCECGVPLLRGSRFCTNCGRPVHDGPTEAASDATVIAPATVRESS
jgi:hypothetical protein